MELLIIIGFYFLPTIIGLLRRSIRTGGILVVNLTLGWTIIGWIVALSWAAGSDTVWDRR